MALTPQMMRLSLDELRKKDRGYMHARPYTDFLPATMGNRQPANEESFNSLLPTIGQRGQAQTKLTGTFQRNANLVAALQQAKAQGKDMRSFLKQLQREQPELRHLKPGTLDLSDLDLIFKGGKGGRGVGGIGAGGHVPGLHGRDPQALINRMNPMMRGHLTSFSLPGLPNGVTVNKTVAPLFKGFLHALLRSGYKIHSIGSHNIRKQASGSGLWSLHSYGLAIDINPQQNPYQSASGHMTENLPPGIGRLAARYGLSWGGNWHSAKDPMHFSVAWRGRE